ncbi:MAG TPA: hypothetical protein ENH82_12785 [bacterium]|nr:hypothetical protein [bacterium]
MKEIEVGTKVRHKMVGTGVVQKLYNQFHPNKPSEFCYIRLDNPPENYVNIILVAIDKLEEIK